RNRLEEGRSSVQGIRRLEAEDSSATRAVETAAQRLKQFRDVASRVEANRKIEIALAAELPHQHAREQEARTALARTEEQIAESDKQAHALSGREHHLEKLAGAVLRAQRKDDLARQLAAIERGAAELLETDARLSQARVKPKTIEELDELDRHIATLDAQLSA